MTSQRELFASRLGFILMTAGCAIGLGNVWRFPYIAGACGGGMFVFFYLFFLLVLGFPVMLMELAVGRAGRSTFPGAFRKLQNPDAKFRWSWLAMLLFSGNFLLLMFYAPVTGWLLAYVFFGIRGDFEGMSPGECAAHFEGFLADWKLQAFFMAAAVVVTTLICLGGVRRTVEKSVKVMMGGLFIMMVLLVVRSLMLPGAAAGVKFYFNPSFENFFRNGVGVSILAAMTQAFFTLSLGIGAIAVCGSYFERERSLAKEGAIIILLDTLTAICAGLIIFPACMTFGIDPGQGPGLIFVTLPSVFQNMAAGRIVGALFFMFLTVAALSTLVAVFENLAAFGMDELKWSRRRSCIVFGIALLFFSMPCIWGFNLWREVDLLGGGSNIMDFEDFLVSDNLLPLGALTLTLFCSLRCGWGSDSFYREVNNGSGWRLSPLLKRPFFVLPALLISVLWLIQIIRRFWR